jgi:hypothetical protein
MSRFFWKRKNTATATDGSGKKRLTKQEKLDKVYTKNICQIYCRQEFLSKATRNIKKTAGKTE